MAATLSPGRRGVVRNLAIGPEAEIDKPGYAKAVRLANQRLKRLEKAKAKE
jgi:hypothetical protein